MIGIPRVVGVLLAIGATVGLTRASSASLSPHGDQAILRLAWTARPERIEDCRQQSDEELSKLPAHMRLALGLDNLKPVEVPVDDAFLRFYMTLLASKLSDRVAPRGAN